MPTPADISGGYSSSMLDAIRKAVHVSNTVSLAREGRTPDYQPLTHKEAFRLATLGGAKGEAGTPMAANGEAGPLVGR